VVLIGVSVSIAWRPCWPVLARRAALGEGLVGAALGLLRVNMVRQQSHPLELG
jgi:hypothetical protein